MSLPKSKKTRNYRNCCLLAPPFVMYPCCKAGVQGCLQVFFPLSVFLTPSNIFALFLSQVTYCVSSSMHYCSDITYVCT
jgi:hypothetical protein